MTTTKKYLALFFTIAFFALLGGYVYTTSSITDDGLENGDAIKQTEDTSNKVGGISTEVDPMVSYKVQFIATWSTKTHPDYYPTNAHFSPFVAYSHNESNDSKIFTLGQTATDGVEEMAETGATGILVKEIQELIDSGIAHDQTKGKRIDSPGEDVSELELSRDYSRITFVSMLAPSPDWFVSESVDLFDKGWVEEVELPLVTYDAGSDNGEGLTAEDDDTNPKQPISTFSEELQHLGTIIITKIDK